MFFQHLLPPPHCSHSTKGHSSHSSVSYHWQGQSNQAPTVRLNTLRENSRVSSSLEPSTASWLYSPCEFITARRLVATREDFRCLCRTKIRKWKSNLWDKHLSHCSACQIFRVREALRESRYHFEPKETFLHLSACHPALLSFHYLLQVTFSFCFFVVFFSSCYFPWQITVTLSGNKISLFSEEVTLSAEGP